MYICYLQCKCGLNSLTVELTFLSMSLHFFLAPSELKRDDCLRDTRSRGWSGVSTWTQVGARCSRPLATPPAGSAVAPAVALREVALVRWWAETSRVVRRKTASWTETQFRMNYMYSGTSLKGNKDTSTTLNMSQICSLNFTPEMKTPLYTGHFTRSPRCPQ